jgi:uncharacterized heparinase superfamily protein
MQYLKSIYFYFLAIKINLSATFKKIYLTTDYYNSSLQSKVPDQFYFFPNPFLLSSITSYKNFSFKMSRINLNTFWDKQPSLVEEKKINSFLWLNIIDRKADVLIIQRIISSWIDNNKKYKRKIWDNSILSRRVISWILNSEIVLKNTNEYFKKSFFNSIIIQTNHLKKSLNSEHNYSNKIEILTAILLSGLVFKEYLSNFHFGIKELESLIEEFFDKEGFPMSRNPNHLLKFSKYLIIVKECTKDAQQYVPDFLDEIIEKNLNCIRNITTPDNKMPLFNGGTEIKLDDFFSYINNLGYKNKLIDSTVGGIKTLKHKKCFVIFDIGNPPQKKFSSAYQSGPLSFEYYFDKKKIITNCGFGYNISEKAMHLSRLTSAQSCLTINDTSVLKFERNKIINKAFGNSIKGSFKVLNSNLKDEEEKLCSTASHNSYVKYFGYQHKRQIKINKNDESLMGFDELSKRENGLNINYNVRFHLYPGINVIQTMGGYSALIQIEKNRSLIFTSINQKISVEKSIFLGRNKILNNLSIVIAGKLNNESKIINWVLKKNI